MNYNEIWEAVDKLARINGLTPSGLAKKAGLDPTTFNKSKRIRPDGKKRWPSLDSINKITSVCHMSFEDFYHILDETGEFEGIRGQSLIPIYNFSDLGQDSFSEKNASYINFPNIDSDMYAVLINKKNTKTIYPLNSVLILSPKAPIKKGNKILITLKITKETIVGEFINRINGGIKVIDLNSQEKITLNVNEIEKIARIMWVSQ